MRALRWKNDQVIRIGTRKGRFVLAQMLKVPYLRVYEAFGAAEERWRDVETLLRVFVLDMRTDS